MEKALKTAKARGCVIPRDVTLYMDDCWTNIADPPCRPGLRRKNNDPPRDPATEFLDCLNSVHNRVQFTMEREEEKSIAFLDVYITREDDGTLTTRVYRKPSNRNIGLKPQSCQDPKMVAASIKGDFFRCYRLCSSPAQTKESLFLISTRTTATIEPSSRP